MSALRASLGNSLNQGRLVVRTPVTPSGSEVGAAAGHLQLALEMRDDLEGLRLQPVRSSTGLNCVTHCRMVCGVLWGGPAHNWCQKCSVECVQVGKHTLVFLVS